MNLALRMSKLQMLLLALIFVALLVTMFLVIHATMPAVWHTIVNSPDVMNGWH